MKKKLQSKIMINFTFDFQQNGQYN